jgi:pimeloyl-ACP methyl ester carboxylesterase
MGLKAMIPGAQERVLKVGDLAFTAWEMGEGPVVICLHGFPDTPATWRHLLPELAAAGYRAVAVTSRGYEPSSQPSDCDYSLAALSCDVIGWIEALDVDQAHLVGHDWGSSICHIAAARAPERVLSLTALAVPHPAGFGAVVATDFEQLERSWYVFLFQAEALSDVIVEADDFALLEHLWRRWSPGWSPDPIALEAMRRVFAKPGVRTAALGYYRGAFDAAHPRAAESARLGMTPIQAPVLGLSGQIDGCISPDVFEASMPPALFPGGRRLERWPAVGHFLHLENPGLAGERIARWLARPGDASEAERAGGVSPTPTGPH